jgi:hypothetical protein
VLAKRRARAVFAGLTGTGARWDDPLVTDGFAGAAFARGDDGAPDGSPWFLFSPLPNRPVRKSAMTSRSTATTQNIFKQPFNTKPLNTAHGSVSPSWALSKIPENLCRRNEEKQAGFGPNRMKISQRPVAG